MGLECFVTFDFLETFDISLIVMDIPGICRPPVSETSAVSHVSWSAAVSTEKSRVRGGGTEDTRIVSS